MDKKGKASCISTFNFSTLYTKIPHDKLLFVLNELTDVCFNWGDRELLSVTKFGARWVTRPSPNGVTFSKESFKEAVRYLMENCFLLFETGFTDKRMVFRWVQIKSILLHTCYAFCPFA